MSYRAAMLLAMAIGAACVVFAPVNRTSGDEEQEKPVQLLVQPTDDGIQLRIGSRVTMSFAKLEISKLPPREPGSAPGREIAFHASGDGLVVVKIADQIQLRTKSLYVRGLGGIAGRVTAEGERVVLTNGGSVVTTGSMAIPIGPASRP